MAQDGGLLISRSFNPLDRGWILRLYDEEGSFERSELLPVAVMQLATAAACLTRIEPLLWDSLIEAEWRMQEYRLDPEPQPEKSRLYRVLRTTLLSSLESMPAFTTAFDLAKHSLPDALPLTVNDHAHAYGLNAEDSAAVRTGKLYFTWTERLKRVGNELTLLGVRENADPFDPKVIAFLVAQDAPVANVESLFRLATESWRNNLTASNIDSEAPSAAGKTRTRSATNPSGRRRIPLEYETAARKWWEMKDEFEERGEARAPNLMDLSDRLTAEVISMRPRALQERIKGWRQAGLPWPPVRPK
jgi:hypothetical protein